MLTQNGPWRTTDLFRPAEASASPFAPSSGANGPAKSYFSQGANRIGTSLLRQILIVDDEPDIRDLVARTVAGVGFRADTAEDGEEGWDALCQTNYDLLITDHDMPRLKGLALIQRLRAVSSVKPCILMSGSLPEPEPILKNFVHPGVVIAKPFSPGALIEKVRALLFSNETQAPLAT